MPFLTLTGELPLIAPTSVLRLVVLAPVASGIAAATLRPRLLASAREARAVAVAGPLFSAAVVTMHAASFAGRAFVDGPLVLGRIGSFDLALSLLLDPRAAVLALAACALCVTKLVATVDLVELLDRAPRVGLALAGVLLAVLGDSVLAYGIGATLLALATARPSGLGIALAPAGVVVAFAASFALAWGLGGSFGIRLDHEPDFTRRNPVPGDIYAAGELGYDAEATTLGPELWPVLSGPRAASTALPKSQPGELPKLAAPGYVSLVGAPGARLFLKGAVEGVGVSPVVRKEVPSGFVDIEVEPRHGERRVRFRAVMVPPGREVVVVSVGPTLSFRELATELAIDDGSGRFIRKTLDPEVSDHRRALGLPVVELVVIAFALAAALIGLSGSGVLGIALHGLIGVSLLSRVAGLGLPTRLAGPIALAFALAALALAAFTVRLPAPRRRTELARVLVAVAAAGALVAPNAASLLVGLGLASLLAVATVFPGAGHALELRVLPLVAGAVAAVALLDGRALVVATFGAGGAGKAAAAMLVVAMAAVLFQVRRLVPPGKRKKKASASSARIAGALALGAAAGALLVGSEPLRFAPTELLSSRLGGGGGTELALTGLLALALVAAWVVGPRFDAAAEDA